MSTPTRQDIERRITHIDEMLSKGVTSVTTDGTTTVVDLNALRAERSELRKQLGTMRQPTSASINLSHG